jgi:hypothetical protein
MAGAKVVILHALRREGGGARRLSTWVDLFTSAGAEALPVSVLARNRFQARISFRSILEVASRRAPIETAVWSRDALVQELASIRPDVLVCMTLRTWSPRVIGQLDKLGTTRLIVDLVDPLSQSYLQRSRIAGGVTGVAFRLLAGDAVRSESLAHRVSQVTVAAGFEDARTLGTGWIPIVAREGWKVRPEQRNYPWHAIFVGSLDYPPNVDAVERLSGRIWPLVRRSVPDAVLAVAGRRPTPRLMKAVNSPGIQFIGPFEEFETVAGNSAISVSPLSVSTGFQIKVLDAAQVGLPQVVTSAALRGFAPGFPARVADGDEEFARAVVELLADPRGGVDLADAARTHVDSRYTVQAWVDEARTLIEP